MRREREVVALVVDIKTKVEMVEGDEKEDMVKEGEGGCRFGNEQY